MSVMNRCFMLFKIVDIIVSVIWFNIICIFLKEYNYEIFGSIKSGSNYKI